MHDPDNGQRITFGTSNAPSSRRYLSVVSMRVVYWNNIPAPYMVDRFNALVTHGHIELEAWFSQRREPDRSWIVDESNWRFKHRYLGANSVRAVIAASRLLRTNPPDVLVC